MERVQGAWQGDRQALMAPALDKDAKNAVACSTADVEGFAAGMRLVRGQGHGLLGPTKDAVEHPVLVVIEIDADGRQPCCHNAYSPSCGPACVHAGPNSSGWRQALPPLARGARVTPPRGPRGRSSGRNRGRYDMDPPDRTPPPPLCPPRVASRWFQ